MLRAPELPPGFWGPSWRSPSRRTLPELTLDGMVSAQLADLLRSWVIGGRSLTIASGPSGVGKSTLLASLIDVLPMNRPRIFVRGIHERFDGMPSDGRPATLLVNEISPHLPAYAWGEVVEHALELASRGHQLLTTIHARSVDEIVAQLAGEPLRIRPALIAELGAIAFLEPRGETNLGRLANAVTLTFEPETQGILVERLTESLR